MKTQWFTLCGLCVDACVDAAVTIKMVIDEVLCRVLMGYLFMIDEDERCDGK